MFKHPYTLLAAAAVAFTLHAVPARADHMAAETAIVFDVAIVLPGLALSVPNIVHVAEGRRPPIVWPMMGLIFGAVGAGLSTLALTDVRTHESPTYAIAGLAGSAVAILFGVWAWAQPAGYAALPPTSSRLSVAPLFVQSAGSHHPTYGVAIAGVGF
jgi:hypothetical protein